MYTGIIMDVTNANLGQTITELSSKAVQTARERYSVDLDFSTTSVSKLLTLIEQAHQAYVASPFTGPALEHTIEVWGAYLGETMRRNKGGVWKIDPQQTGDRKVYLATGSGRIHPFEQVRQKITGEETVLPERDTPPLPPVPEKPKSNLLLILLVVFALFAVLAAGAIYMIQTLTQQKTTQLADQRLAYKSPFMADMGNYLKEYPNPAGSDPALIGKVLVVSRHTSTVADLQYKLPQEMRATGPADLGVVVQEECSAVETATDPKSGAALTRLSCRLTLVDYPKKEAAYQQDFVSNEFNELKDGVDPGSYLDPTIMVTWLDAMID